MFRLIREICNDTLKKNGKWSRTSLTMFTAWVTALFMALHDLYQTGFKFEVFVTFVGVALGTKITDSIGNRIHPPQDINNEQPI